MPTIPTLTAPQARALRFYGAPQPRSAHRAVVGDLPRRDVTERLESLGLLEAADGVPYPLSFDRQLTAAGRSVLTAESTRRGWPPVEGRRIVRGSRTPARGIFACSSLNRSRCDYESTERDR